MPNIDLGQHLDRFVREQVESGRFRTVSDVVQAGLRLLEDQTFDLAGNGDLRRMIDEAFEDPRPSVPAETVFADLRAHHARRGRTARIGG